MPWQIVRALLALLILSCVAAQDFPQCNENNFGNMVASTTSCRHYIYCDKGASFEGECEDDSYFHASLGTCESERPADCKIDGNNTTMTPPTNRPVSNLDISTLAFSNGTTAMPTNGTTLAGNVTVTLPSMEPTGATIATALKVIVLKQCPASDKRDEMVLLAHTSSCADYFVCYKGEAIEMHCAASLHFNANTGKCDYTQNVNCFLPNVPAKKQCGSQTVAYMPHTTNCNYYYYCHNGFLMLQQCAPTQGWDYEKHSCVKIAEAKCLPPTAM